MSFNIDEFKNLEDEILVKAIRDGLFNEIKIDDELKNLLKEELVKRNKKLVFKIAKNYRNNKVDFEDLLQIGDIAVVKASNNFEPENNDVKFATYAYKVINSAIKNEVYNSSLIRMPEKKRRALSKINKYRNEYYLKNGKKPTNEEVAYNVNVSANDVIELDSFLVSMIDLDERIDSDSEQVYLDFVLDDNDAETCTIMFENNCVLNDGLSRLSEIEYQVITERFGINSKQKTLKEIGLELGCDSNKVNSIQGKALKKLKSYFIEEGIARDFFSF